MRNPIHFSYALAVCPVTAYNLLYDGDVPIYMTNRFEFS